MSGKEAVKQRQGAARLKDFGLAALRTKLPLRFPSPVQTELPAEWRSRSWYRYPGWAGLTERGALENAGLLYIALHLIDFSPLRAELMQLQGIQANARGGTPYDPVSLFLCGLLRRELRLGWRALAQLLGSEAGACWRRLLGFAHDDLPAESTMRGFFKGLQETFIHDLCPRFIELLQQAGLLPPHDPQTTVPARDGGAARYRWHASRRAQHVPSQQISDDLRYQLITAENPRPCPAREAAKRAAPRHPGLRSASPAQHPARSQARFIITADAIKMARNILNARAMSTAIAATLSTWEILPCTSIGLPYSTVHPANTDERTIFPTDFAQLRQRLPQLPISEVSADAAAGFAACLETIYHAGAIPVVDIRADDTDKDPDACLLRGYDANGHPLCAHGHAMAYNGLDYARLRATWCCRQLCTRNGKSTPAAAECPFRDPARPLGMVKHVGLAFTHPDGSSHTRPARFLYPYNSRLWKRHYGRRNTSESRNSQLEALGLKRIPSYGLRGAAAEIAFADLLINLRTLSRLLRQAAGRH